MVRFARLTAALVLMLATGVATPLTFLWCEDGCDDIQVAARTSTEPACHHVVRTGQRLETPPRACGHDHSTFIALRPSMTDERSTISHAPVDAIVLIAAELVGSRGRLAARPPVPQPDTSPHLVASTVLRI